MQKKNPCIQEYATKEIINFNDSDWKLSKCSCCYWLKNYMWSHVIILEKKIT